MLVRLIHPLGERSAHIAVRSNPNGVRFGSKADVGAFIIGVHFAPKSGSRWHRIWLPN